MKINLNTNNFKRDYIIGTIKDVIEKDIYYKVDNKELNKY